MFFARLSPTFSTFYYISGKHKAKSNNVYKIKANGDEKASFRWVKKMVNVK